MSFCPVKDAMLGARSRIHTAKVVARHHLLFLTCGFELVPHQYLIFWKMRFWIVVVRRRVHPLDTPAHLASPSVPMTGIVLLSASLSVLRVAGTCLRHPAGAEQLAGRFFCFSGFPRLRKLKSCGAQMAAPSSPSAGAHTGEGAMSGCAGEDVLGSNTGVAQSVGSGVSGSPEQPGRADGPGPSLRRMWLGALSRRKRWRLS